MANVQPDAYVRHRALEGFGPAGQQALSDARVAMVGVGGLGCPAALYLAAAGVGHIALFDSDTVSVTNLHRQVLFGPNDVGAPKVDAAAKRLRELAPNVRLDPRNVRLGEDAAEQLAGYDLILDGTDTWPSRLTVADAAAELNTPLVWGALSGWYGQVTVFDQGRSLRDLFPVEPPPDFGVCEGGGVLGPLCGQVGTAMASQALVLLAGSGPGLRGILSILDAREGVWRSLPVGKSANA